MSFNKLDATVFVYRSRIDGRIHAEYIDTAREMDKSPDWEHIATLEPRLWIQHNYATPQPPHDDSLTAAYMMGRADDTALLRQALGALESMTAYMQAFEPGLVVGAPIIDQLRERLK